MILLRRGPMRFSELRRHLPNITAKLLSIRLRELILSDLIDKKCSINGARPYVYSIHSEDIELCSALDHLSIWYELQVHVKKNNDIPISEEVLRR